MTNKSELPRRTITARTIENAPSTLVPDQVFIGRALFSAAAVVRSTDMAGYALNVAANIAKADIASGVDKAKERLDLLRTRRDALISIKRLASKAPTVRLAPHQFEIIRPYWPDAVLPTGA